MLLALVVVVLLSFQDSIAALSFVGETIAFIAGVLSGLIVGSFGARSFVREDGYSDRIKLVMAWVSFVVILGIGILVILIVDMDEREVTVAEFTQGLLLGTIGTFWRIVLDGTLWRSHPAKKTKFFQWLAFAASGTLTSLVAAVLVHGVVLTPVIRQATL